MKDEGSGQLIERLRELAAGNPGLKEYTVVYETLLPLLRGAGTMVAPVELSVEEASEKLGKGLFLLHDVELDIDMEGFRSLMIRLAEALEKRGEEQYPLAGQAGRIRSYLEGDLFDLGSFLLRLAGSKGVPEGAEESAPGLDADLLRTLGWSAFRTCLKALQQQLAPLVDVADWDKGHCFVCGAAAGLAELRGNNQSRHLRCSQCFADWPVRRLQCIYCCNDDHRSLGFLYEENKENGNKVEVCDRCRGYIKVLPSFDPLPAEMLIVEDLATLPLDFIAMDRGYARSEAVG